MFETRAHLLNVDVADPCPEAAMCVTPDRSQDWVCLSSNSPPPIPGSYERYSQTPEGSRMQPVEPEIDPPGAYKCVYFCHTDWTTEGLAVHKTTGVMSPGCHSVAG